MVQAGETPDIVEMPERWMGLYANNGQLEDLGPYMEDGRTRATLGDRAKQFGSTVKNTQYMIPYGYYVRAHVLEQEAVRRKPASTDAPTDARRIRGRQQEDLGARNGKYGYCLRGGPGAFSGIQMFMNIANGKAGYFNEDGTSTFNEEGSVKGLQMLADIYKNG